MSVNVLELERQVLSIADVAELTPYSERSLYRIAADEDSPFTKRCGKWSTTPEALKAWVESGPKPGRRKVGNPMPRRSRGDDVMAQVLNLRRSA